MRPQIHSALLVFIVVLMQGCASAPHVYLTWQGDPSTTMTVNYQSDQDLKALTLHYDTESHDGDPNAYRYTAVAESGTVPGLEGKRYVYHVEAANLEPGALYYFVLAEGSSAVTAEMRFRPLPEKDQPIRFISGGDMFIFPRTHQLTKLAASKDPMFGLIGGDMAYANGEVDSLWIWDQWLKMWQDNMVTSDGVLIPMVLAIGNHEVNDEEGPIETRAPFYYGFFPQGGLPYFSQKLRHDTVLIVLDSGHTIPHGDQVQWLENTFLENQDTRNTVAVYHAPLYPSHRDFDDGRAVAGRKNWLSIFDTYGLRVALENHDHAFKRTKVLKNGQVAESGTVYLGDGCFGQKPRSVPDTDRWYLEKASPTPHFWLVDIDDSGMHFQAISHADDRLDQVDFE